MLEQFKGLTVKPKVAGLVEGLQKPLAEMAMPTALRMDEVEE